jgi:hypothetical protein
MCQDPVEFWYFFRAQCASVAGFRLVQMPPNVNGRRRLGHSDPSSDYTTES